MRTQKKTILIICLRSQVCATFVVLTLVTLKTPSITGHITKKLILLHARGAGTFSRRLIHSSDTSVSSTSRTLQKVAQSPKSPNQLKTKSNEWWMKIRVQCTTFDRFPVFFLSSSYLWFCSTFTFFVYVHQLLGGETIQPEKKYRKLQLQEPNRNKIVGVECKVSALGRDIASAERLADRPVTSPVIGHIIYIFYLAKRIIDLQDIKATIFVPTNSSSAAHSQWIQSHVLTKSPLLQIVVLTPGTSDPSSQLNANAGMDTRISLTVNAPEESPILKLLSTCVTGVPPIYPIYDMLITSCAMPEKVYSKIQLQEANRKKVVRVKCKMAVLGRTQDPLLQIIQLTPETADLSFQINREAGTETRISITVTKSVPALWSVILDKDQRRPSVLIVEIFETDIPKLTYEEFKDFHRKFYHLSNARIWFYGDDDTNERFLCILSEYLDLFDASPVSSESKIQPQPLFSKPVRIIEKYPASEGAELKNKPLDLQTELALGFMDHLMLGTAASPLRKILLESGLGEAIVGGGIEDELLQPQFSIGLKGVSEEDIQKVEELVMTTLKSLAEEVFDLEAVEASMNTIEFSLSENNTGSFPRGLSLMLRSMGKWIYDMDPFEPLKFEKPLASLKARIAKEGSKAVFFPLIEKFILYYPHLVTAEMQPDPEKASRNEAVEKEILDKVKAGMTEEDLAELARATQELRLKQETPDTPKVLRTVPSLSLHDIPKKPMRVPIEVGEIDGVKALKHDLFTNDVLYTEIVFNMSSLRQELLPLVPLFCQSLLEMGTKDMDFVQLYRLIGGKTGGISVYPYTSSIRGREDPCSHMIVRGKAMAGRADDLFHLVNCILQDVQFTDQQRFKQFVSQSKARMESEKKYRKIQLQEFNKKKIVRVESRMAAVGRDIAWDVRLAELKVTTPLQGVKFTIFVPTNSSSTAHSQCIQSQVLTKSPLLQIVVFTPETGDLSNQLNIDAGMETRISISVNAPEENPILKQLSTGVTGGPPIYPVYAKLVTSCALPEKEYRKIQLQEANRKKIVRVKCKMAALGRTQDSMLQISRLTPETGDLSSQLNRETGMETQISITVTKSVPALWSVILDKDQRRPSVLIVVIIFEADAFDVADELRMLKYILITTTTIYTALMKYLPTMGKQLEPIQIPGCKAIQGYNMKGWKNDLYNMLLPLASLYAMVQGFLINTCEVLEQVAVNALKELPILKQQSTGVPLIYPVYAKLVTSCASPEKENWNIQLQEANRKKIVRVKCKMSALGRDRAWAERLAGPGIGHIIHTVSLAKPITVYAITSPYPRPSASDHPAHTRIR